jgi:hypothetical protein
MLSPNYIFVASVFSIIVSLTLVCLLADLFFWLKRRFSKDGVRANAEVIRGDNSMSMLYTIFISINSIFFGLANMIKEFESNQLVIVFVVFICLSYMFFFSSWFRNRIFFNIANRIRND